jgi:DNA polymerase-3 subunit delta'
LRRFTNAFARRWSVSWQRVRGHDSLVESFDGIVRRGRLAHAYLFAGPPGVGKRLFADELAKALLCEGQTGPRLEACDHCSACAQVKAGTHPDFFVAVRPEETLDLPIEVVRTLCQSFALKSARGRGKIAILDDADDLNDAAANCFLKTLEEPPPRSVLLLIGTSADRQLSTIVSRCQVVRFAPLPQALVAELLRAQGLEDAALIERLARLSDGSPGLARALADPALWEFRRTLLDRLAQLPRDSVPLAQAILKFVDEAGKESGAQRRRAALLLRLLIEFLHAALTKSAGGEPRLAEPEDLRVLEALVQRTDPDQLTSILERCLEAETQIDRRVQLVLLLEALIDSLSQKLK